MGELNLKQRLEIFMENEARSCSMDFGCIIPLYVYRMWYGEVSIDEIEKALRELSNSGCNYEDS